VSGFFIRLIIPYSAGSTPTCRETNKSWEFGKQKIIPNEKISATQKIFVRFRKFHWQPARTLAYSPGVGKEKQPGHRRQPLARGHHVGRQ
jgi:hypothetical protein